MDEPEGPSSNYALGFATEEAYEQFAEVDCEELREMIDVLRADPFPVDEGLSKFRIPGGGEIPFFVIWRMADGFLYKLSYGVQWQPRRVGITAASVQPLPEIDVGGPL